MAGTTNASTLDEAVDAFVDQLLPAVEELAADVPGLDVGRLRSDVVVDAYNLACGFIDADERHVQVESFEGLLEQRRAEVAVVVRALAHRRSLADRSCH